jgi:hypothetical protein
MAIDSIIALIDAEIASLTQVRALLASTGKIAAKGTGNITKKAAKKGKKRRVLSADARKRIADAQRKRWAAQKSKAK